MAVEHVEGQTEPWIVDILVALLKGLQREAPNVVELGGFQGHTSLRLGQAMTSGTLTIAEYDPEAPGRAQHVSDRLFAANLPPEVTWRVLQSDALAVIAQCADESLDFVFVDDDHTTPHVQAEIDALIPKMRVGGLICFHDVYGSCDLHHVVERAGGYCLDLPRLGPAGGLGVLQVR